MRVNPASNCEAKNNSRAGGNEAFWTEGDRGGSLKRNQHQARKETHVTINNG